MLIRFCMQNYLSFRDPAELTLVPGRVRRFPDHIIRAKSETGIDVLKLGLIYGPNASGKSNLVRGISDARKYIVLGTRPKGGFKANIFKLDPCAVDLPTIFEFTIKIDAISYEYGFSYQSGAVREEWLNAVTEKETVVVFKRSYSERIEDYELFWEALDFENEEDQQFFSFTHKGTPENKLFLTECGSRGIKKNIPYLNPVIDVFEWFDDKLTVIFPLSMMFPGLEFAMHESDVAADVFSRILKKFDVGIEALELVEVDLEMVLEGLPKEQRSKMLSDLRSNEAKTVTVFGGRDERYLLTIDKQADIVAYKVGARHQDFDGNPVNFDMTEESDGTRRLLDMIPGVLGFLADERVVIIDEIDSNMHPAITRSIISSFLSITSGQESQLIATTHDASLLDQKVLRKDEVWFTEKTTNNSSRLFSLEEFKDIRFDRNLSKSYIEGRFGGVPLISELELLKTKVDE